MEVNLDIVFTDFSLSLFSLLRLLLLTHFRDIQEAEILFPLIFLHNKNTGLFLLFMDSVRSLKPGPTLVPGLFLHIPFSCVKI